jgi:preprotein translocase subunit SecD
MKNNFVVLFIVLIIVGFSISVVLPKGPDYFGRETKMHLGLDLQGGAQLLYKIDTSNTAGKSPAEVQSETVDLITRRVDDLGVSEPVVQGTKVGNDYGVLVELPGEKDVEQAKKIIGKTAQLRFYELDANGHEVPTDLTGADVSKASAGTDKSQAGFSSVSPIIYLEFNKEGADKFKEITKRNVGKVLIIKLDDEVINEATVQTEISGGKAQIEGIKTLKEATDTARLINEGALPAPIYLIQESQVGASLGRDAIEKSLIAGLIGLILVAVFMIIYYGWLGVAAVVALIIYTLIVTSLFKLIPVTLTLAGIAGFVFSIGAAVDANILVFERFKEEKEKDIPITQALENGFSRSWPSIRDSNIASLITSGILFYMSTGLVKGFAVTLAIGIAVSLFTALTVTRTILRFFIKNK